ncbi:M48 family metalloprotease [Nocardia inohanensis]|uniref:M48 family metalloprotease n=1 Tax=Nocardia inohanensis TaxID=209246 RepID=UPI000833FD02|nr:M48 family metalloprotease [Nocardia inohanensis]
MTPPRLESASPARRAVYRWWVGLRGLLLTIVVVAANLPAAVLNVLLLRWLDHHLGRIVVLVLIVLWSLVVLWLLFLAMLFGAGRHLPELPAGSTLALDEAWRDVRQLTGIRPRAAPGLMVTDEDRVTAAANGGLVTISRKAVRTLSPDAMRAVLAHELGHYFDRHGHRLRTLSRATAFPLWAVLALPGIPVLWLGRLFGKDFDDPIAWLPPAFVQWSALAYLACLVGQPVGTGTALLLAALAAVSPIIRQVTHRRLESISDQVTVDVGYGPALSKHLEYSELPVEREFLNEPGLERYLARLLHPLQGTHPLAGKRIAAIERRIRRRELTHR